MKKLALLMLLALPALAQSNDLGIEILAPPTAAWFTDFNVIIRASSYGPSQFPDTNLIMNVGIHNGSAPLWPGSGWSCKFASSGGIVSGICSRAGITTGTFPDLVLQMSMSKTDVTVGANVSGGTGNDPGPHPNDAEATIQSIPPAAFDINITSSPATPHPGDVVTYTYKISNTGPQAAPDVQLRLANCCNGPEFISASTAGWTCEPYSPGVRQLYCTMPSMPVGPAPTVTMTVQMPLTPGQHGTSATVSSPFAVQAFEGFLFDVQSAADLRIVEISGPATAQPNAVVQHEVIVANNGPGVAQPVSVSLSGTAIAGEEGVGWSCADDICTRSSMAPGSVAPPVVVTSQMPASGSMSLRATVSSGTDDLVPENDSKDIVVTVAGTMSIAAISPRSGSTAGGTVVTITGEGFTPQSEASFDNVTVPTTYVSATTLLATTRAHVAGIVDVAVANGDSASAMLVRAFTFEPVGRRRAARH